MTRAKTRQGNPDGFRDKWDCSTGTGVYLQNENHSRIRTWETLPGHRSVAYDSGSLKLDRKLDVHQSFYLKFTGQFTCLHFDFFHDLGWQAVRRNDTSGIAGMNAGFFDMLHDTADSRNLSIKMGLPGETSRAQPM